MEGLVTHETAPANIHVHAQWQAGARAAEPPEECRMSWMCTPRPRAPTSCRSLPGQLEVYGSINRCNSSATVQTWASGCRLSCTSPWAPAGSRADGHHQGNKSHPEPNHLYQLAGAARSFGVEEGIASWLRCREETMAQSPKRPMATSSSCREKQTG